MRRRSHFAAQKSSVGFSSIVYRNVLFKIRRSLKKVSILLIISVYFHFCLILKLSISNLLLRFALIYKKFKLFKINFLHILVFHSIICSHKTGNLRTYCQLKDRRIFSNVSQWVGFVERVMTIVSMCRLSGGDGWLSRCDWLNFLSELKIVLPSVCLAKKLTEKKY